MECFERKAHLPASFFSLSPLFLFSGLRWMKFKSKPLCLLYFSLVVSLSLVSSSLSLLCFTVFSSPPSVISPKATTTCNSKSIKFLFPLPPMTLALPSIQPPLPPLYSVQPPLQHSSTAATTQQQYQQRCWSAAAALQKQQQQNNSTSGSESSSRTIPTEQEQLQ